LKSVYRQVKELMTTWLNVSLFGSGFFHADLHPGNVMVRTKDKSLVIIDYGSVGVLSRVEQCRMMTAMILSGQLIQPQDVDSPQDVSYNQSILRRFVRSLLSVCQVQSIDLAEFQALVNQLLTKKAYWFGNLFLEFVEHAPDIGECTRSASLLFGRGSAYLQNIIMLLKESCSDEDCPFLIVSSIIRQGLMKRPKLLYRLWRTGQLCPSSERVVFPE
jgi:serine/threonine protein kinase